uniref:hypothetical protein n=1 Tax=Neokomagataea thailandica TaxID=661190 RepID=UPI002265E260|nr:hypothetical protein [Neokomagataea thailandica]
MTPPARVRNSIKASGWVYDRDTDVWKRRVSEETLDAIRDEVVALELQHQAVIDHDGH